MFTPARLATARVRRPSNPASATTSKAACNRAVRRLPCSSWGSRSARHHAGWVDSIIYGLFNQSVDWFVNQMIDNMISGQRRMGLEENQGKSDGIDTKENA